MKNINFFYRIKKQLIEHKSIIVIMSIYLLFLIGSIFYFFFIHRIRDALMSILFIIFVPLFFFVQYILKIEFGPLFTFVIYFIASGAILGACYDFYHIFPIFDDVLHGLSGFIFSCLGYSIVCSFFGKIDTTKKFMGSVVLGAIFSLAVGLIWELFEYTVNCLFGFDMLADTYITGFNSYLLSGTHSEYVAIEGIEKTIIYYGNQVYELNGYLDIGLIDSMNDMVVCFIGALMFLIITIVSRFKFKKINDILLPKSYKNKEVVS